MRRALTAGVLLAIAAPYGAAAQQVSPALRFRIRAWPDAAIIGSSLAAALVPLVFSSSFAHATCAPCDPASLWWIDRGTVGPVRATADAFSTGTLATEVALGAVFLASSRKGQGTAAFFEDATVITQAMTVTAAATEWAKVLFHRPRPYLYLPGAGAPGADDVRSMPSSHTSVAFAAAAAYASILHRRGIAKSHAAQIGVLLGAGTLTGALRVVAHKHFPTDVVAGAALGFAIGWILPAAHATAP
ncbi:MAG TPA: phosphatase PAP2 family protein [Gemmatimonadales bacterium]|nr:phosphatase PAP2 family protein [Gemmatimonadales bacterium]